MFLSSAFKQKKQESGMTISDISKKSGVAEHYIKNLLADRVAHPDSDKIIKLAKAMEVDSSEFYFTGEEIFEDLMRECEDVIKSIIKKNKLQLSKSDLEVSIKNAYDYAIKRKQAKKRPALDDLFVKFFISKYQK